MNPINKIFLISFALVASTLAQGSGKVSDKTDQQIRQALKHMAPAAKVISVENTPMQGVKEVTLDSGRGGEVYYVSDSGEYLITGNMYNTQTREDLTYCRKLHSQMDEYNKRGIGVSYLFFPRAGLKSNSYDKAVAVWCAEDKQEAMTKAKTGIQVDLKKCDNPVAEHYKTGQAVGVSGTPAIVLDNGTLMPGYLPPDALLQRVFLCQDQAPGNRRKASPVLSLAAVFVFHLSGVRRPGQRPNPPTPEPVHVQ